jgi:hydrogenase maturation protease
MALGNPLMAEDSFGPRVLRKLRDTGLAGVDLLDAHTDLLGHIEDLLSYTLVVIIDALLDPAGSLGPAGEVFAVEQPQLLSLPDDASSIHQMSPVTALKLFRTLYPDAGTRFVLVAYGAPGITFSGAPDESLIERAAALVRTRVSEL